MRDLAGRDPEAGTPAEIDTPLLGRRLGEFVIREKLGEGSTALVFRAEQPLLAREAVIKVLGASVRPNDETVQRFLREARLASHLDHPYAAHIYAFGAEPDGLLWIAMEFVHGTPLDKLLKTQGPLLLTRFVPLLDRICEVVQTAHDQGIIHRDLKPANVMVLSRAGRLLPKLLDFGIAKLLAETVEPADPGQREPLAPSAVVAMDERVLRAGLTQRGPYIGTAHYMAPEQWLNAAAVDQRTDIYALAVLSFEALTGRRPFEGMTTLELAREHASKPLPPLGGDLPEALHAVLSRALAKRGPDRFASVLEFAAAFRGAAGLTEEPDQLPQVDDAIRERTIAEGPQPIAEALSALEASRSVATALEAASGVRRALVQYLGILALASRSRIGPGSDADSAPVLELLRKLRSHSLAEGEWIALARELCRLFVRHREAYPVPELISFFFERERESETTWSKALGDEVRSEGEPGPLPEAQRRELLARKVARLTQTLRAMPFLFDYQLMLTQGNKGESWTGVRRAHRIARQLQTQIPDSRPVLLDREGNFVLSLWPLMQALVPTPGATPELFMLSGHGRHGAKLVAFPLGFERHDETLWNWFSEHIHRLDDEGAGEREEAAPYLGLLPFTPGDAKNFFGRERETEAFANRLRVQQLLAVVGPSGSGKSSFIQAGVIPALPPDWHAITMRPGAAPLTGLANRLAHEGKRLEISSDVWRTPEIAADQLRTWARECGSPILLVVDQFEELLTLCPDPQERSQFSRAIVAAAEGSTGEVRIVLTLRDDFLIRAQQLPGLRDALGVGLQLLSTPAPEDLLRILLCPAQRAGYEFDDPELPAQMVKEVAEQPGALALLSFTGSKLWELRDRQFHRLSRRAYESLGGVGGALAQHAEATLSAMPFEQQGLVREAFRHLVTADRTRAVLSRKEMSQVLGGGPAAESALERLIHARLLTASDGEGGEDRIEVIHEALLTSWPRLVRWQQEDAESARMRHQLRAATRQWEERKRGKGLLWRKEALMEYRVWRSRYSGRLTESEEAFAAASLREENRGRRTRRLLLAGAFVMLAIGLVAVARANRIAHQRLLASYEEQGRQLLLAGDPLRGIVYLEQAYREGADSPALRFLLGRATHALDVQVASLRHAGPVVDAHYSPDGKRVVTASLDRTAKVWEADKGKLLATLSGHTDAVHSARFSPDSRWIVTSSSDGTAKMWDAARGELLGTLDAGSPIQAPTLADFSADGNIIVTAVGPTAKVWDAHSLAEIASLRGHQKRIKMFAIDPKTNDILTYGQDGLLKRFEKSGHLLFGITAQLEDNYAQYVTPLALSPDGETVITGTVDGRVNVWNAKTGQRLFSVPSGSGFVRSTAIRPDNQEFLTATDEPAIRVWNMKTGAMTRLLQGHSTAVWSALYNTNGTQLLTTSGDTTARLWNTSWGGTELTFVGHTNTVVSADFSSDHKGLITASLDGTAKLWDKNRSPLLFDVYFSSSTITNHLRYAQLSADGARLLSATTAGKVEIYDLAHSHSTSALSEPNRCCSRAAWSPEETQLAVTLDNTVSVFDVPAGTLRFTADVGSPISALAYSPDGALLAIGAANSCGRIFDARSGTIRLELKNLCGKTLALRFSSDGHYLLTGGDARRLVLWNVADGTQVFSIEDFKGPIWGIAFSPDDSRFITASRDKRVIIWNSQTGTPLVFFEEAKAANVNVVEFNRAGTLVLTGDVSGVLATWDAATGRLLGSYSRSAVPIEGAKFSGDGSRVLGFDTDAIAMWDTASELRTLKQMRAYVRCRVPFRLEAGNLITAPIESKQCDR